jgi:hypothetical protein
MVIAVSSLFFFSFKLTRLQNMLARAVSQVKTLEGGFTERKCAGTMLSVLLCNRHNDILGPHAQSMWSLHHRDWLPSWGWKRGRWPTGRLLHILSLFGWYIYYFTLSCTVYPFLLLQYLSHTMKVYTKLLDLLSLLFSKCTCWVWELVSSNVLLVAWALGMVVEWV